MGKRQGKKREPVVTLDQVLALSSIDDNGIATLADHQYSASVIFTDINYQLYSADRQMEIIDRWSRVLASLEAECNLQVSIITRSQGVDKVLDEIAFTARGDMLDPLRDEYNATIAVKLRELSANTSTVKIATLTVSDTDEANAKRTLNTMVNALTAQLNAVDECTALRMSRAQRVEVMSDMLRPTMPSVYRESMGEHVKDSIVPFAATLLDTATVELDSMDSGCVYQGLWVSSYPPEMSDQLIADILSTHCRVSVSVHYAPLSRVESMSKLNSVATGLKIQETQYMQAHKNATSLPLSLTDTLNSVEAMRDELVSSNQRLVRTMLLVGVCAASREELAAAVTRVRSKINALGCTAETIKYMPFAMLTTLLPVGVNALSMFSHTLLSSAAAIFVPFTMSDVYEKTGVFYGVNTASGNPIVADRRAHMNSNGFILGTSGSGKSFSVKQELTGIFLNRDDDVIIIDPEKEYRVLAQAFDGEIIDIHAGATSRINPMDIILESGEADPIKDKTTRLMSVFNAFIGGSDGLTAVEKSLLDRACMSVYRQYREQGGMMPTLSTVHDVLNGMNDDVATHLAVALEQYTSGSLSVFNGQTNVDMAHRLTVFDVSGLHGELRTFGMMSVIDHVWNRVLANRDKGKRTWLYVDEFHRFFANEYTSREFLDLYKRARKYGLGLTGITQNVEELLEFPDARKMLSNSDFLMLLAQTSTDADALCDLLKLSDEQRSYFTTALKGQGIVKIGTTIVPFDNRIRAEGVLYDLYSTTFTDSKGT